jgi:hypothetical protein
MKPIGQPSINPTTREPIQFLEEHPSEQWDLICVCMSVRWIKYIMKITWFDDDVRFVIEEAEQFILPF